MHFHGSKCVSVQMYRITVLYSVRHQRFNSFVSKSPYFNKSTNEFTYVYLCSNPNGIYSVEPARYTKYTEKYINFVMHNKGTVDIKMENHVRELQIRWKKKNTHTHTFTQTEKGDRKMNEKQPSLTECMGSTPLTMRPKIIFRTEFHDIDGPNHDYVCFILIIIIKRSYNYTS